MPVESRAIEKHEEDLERSDLGFEKTQVESVKPTLEEAGIEKNLAHRARKVAAHRSPLRKRTIPIMEHLSDWHAFNPCDRKTYPTVPALIQVRYEGGNIEEGASRMFFPRTALLPCSSINAWRYIKSGTFI